MPVSQIVTNSIANGAVPMNNYQVFTSSGTFTVPAGVSRVKVTVIGAGGSGGNFNTVSGGGGGAGGYIVDYVAVTPSGTATVTVGTNAGTRTSSFAGGTTITASGGVNGTSDGTSIPGASALASVFGVTYYLPGANRSNDTTLTNSSTVQTTASSTSLLGGVYAHGLGAAGTVASAVAGSTNKHTAIGYGAGGGGGSSSSTTGGVGTNGLVIVEW